MEDQATHQEKKSHQKTHEKADALEKEEKGDDLDKKAPKEKSTDQS